MQILTNWKTFLIEDCIEFNKIQKIYYTHTNYTTYVEKERNT